MEPLDYQIDDLDMKKCCDCNVDFFPINEEANGILWEYDFIDPPEVRCSDCQLAFRIKGGNKPPHITHADWVYTNRTRMAGMIAEMQANNYSRQEIRKTIIAEFRKMYVTT